MKILALDIETVPQTGFTKVQKKQMQKKKEKMEEPDENLIASVDPFLGKIICIALYYKNTANGTIKKTALHGDEEQILKGFWDIIAATTSSTKFVHFNGINFDIPFIRIRSLIRKINLPGNSVNFFDTNSYKSPHIDLQNSIRGGKWVGSGISYTLELVCDALKIKTPKDALDGSQVHEYYKQGKIDDICTYCLKDVEACVDIVEYMEKYNVI